MDTEDKMDADELATFLTDQVYFDASFFEMHLNKSDMLELARIAAQEKEGILDAELEALQDDADYQASVSVLLQQQYDEQKAEWLLTEEGKSWTRRQEDLFQQQQMPNTLIMDDGSGVLHATINGYLARFGPDPRPHGDLCNDCDFER